VGDLAQLGAGGVDDRGGVGVGVLVHGCQHRDAGAGDPQARGADDAFDVDAGRHRPQYHDLS
jgi:hypothetical protein